MIAAHNEYSHVQYFFFSSPSSSYMKMGVAVESVQVEGEGVVGRERGRGGRRRTRKEGRQKSTYKSE